MGANGIFTNKRLSVLFRATFGFIFCVLFLIAAFTLMFEWRVDIYFSWDTSVTPIFPRALIGLYFWILLITFVILFIWSCIILFASNDTGIYIKLCSICIKLKSYTFINCPRWLPVQLASFFLCFIWFPWWWFYSTLTPGLWHHGDGDYYPEAIESWYERGSTDEWTLNWVLVESSDESRRRRRTLELDTEMQDVSGSGGDWSLENILSGLTNSRVWFGKGREETLDYWVGNRLDSINSENNGDKDAYFANDFVRTNSDATNYSRSGHKRHLLQPGGEGGESGGESSGGGGAPSSGGAASGEVIMKAFPDLFMWYGWLCAICLVAIISNFSSGVRRGLGMRVFLHQNNWFWWCGQEVMVCDFGCWFCVCVSRDIVGFGD